MNSRLYSILKRAAENLYLGLAAGLVLLLASGHEIYVTIDEAGFSVHHASFFFLVHILKTLPDIVEAIEEMSKK